MKYKITYYDNPERTIVKTKIEETTLTRKQLLENFHVIAVEEIEEIKPKPKK